MKNSKEVKGDVCPMGMCTRCHAGGLIVVGALVLINSVLGLLSWGIFAGGLLVLAGLVKLVKPMCPHCK